MSKNRDALDQFLDLLADKINARHAATLRPMVEEAVKAAWATKPEPRAYYFAPEVAKQVGKSVAGFAMWCKPGRGGAELGRLAVDFNGRKAWRAHDLEAFMARSKNGAAK